MVFSLMRPDSIRLSQRHKIAFYSVLSVVFASGVIWAWLHYFTAERDSNLVLRLPKRGC